MSLVRLVEHKFVLARIISAVLILGFILCVNPIYSRANSSSWSGLISSSKMGNLDCSDMLFVGVRGSTEPAGLGKTIAKFRDELQQATKGSWTKTSQVWLEYPAADPRTIAEFDIADLLVSKDFPQTLYYASVISGAKTLGKLIKDRSQKCPNEKFVFAGYSQGAEVITRALSQNFSKQLLAVALIGNPAQYPNDATIHLQSANLGDDKTIGLTSALFYLREIAQNTRTEKDKSGVKAAVRAVLKLYEGEIENAELSRMVEEKRLVLPENNKVFEICQEGDLICDSARSLGRALVGVSGFDKEVSDALNTHGNYGHEQFEDIVATISERWLALPKPKQNNLIEQSKTQHSPESQSSFMAWVWRFGIGIIGFAIVAVGTISVSRHRKKIKYRIKDNS